MRKALQRAAHVLAAAGALGLARPAVAQTPAPPANGPEGKAVAGPTATRPAPDASQAKLDEFQVELALLGAPATFGYPIVCVHTGSNLELRGYVPNEFVRKQALEIARQNCRVPVVDLTEIHGALALRSPAGAGDELQRGALALVAEVFGPGAGGVEITVVAPGRLVVSGACDSYEEKVAVSKKLRRLHGCCAVENRLTVKPVLRDGRLVALVTVDGSYAVETAPAKPGAPTAAPPAKPTASVTNDVPRPLKNELSPPPGKADNAPAVALKSDVPPLSPVPAPARARFDLIPPPDRKVDAPPPKTDPPPAVALKSDAPPAPRKVEPPPPAPAVAVKADATAPVPTYKPPVAAPLAPPPAKNPADAAVPLNAQVPAVPAKTAPPEGGKWATAHEARPAQAAYATTGQVVFDGDLPDPPPLMKADKLAALKHKVQAVCGPLAKDVVVTAAPDGAVQVQVKTISDRENEGLTMKILQLPEMAAPNVRLDVRLAK
jgi:hypothetical protein